jgi:response regulator NasT
VIPAQQREDGRHGLRVAIANEDQQRLDTVAGVVAEAGHDVVARLVDLACAGTAIAEHRPDVAIVAPGRDPRHALELVAEIAEEGICPVILMLERNDPALVGEAAELGVFGQLTGTEADELQGELEIVLRRYDDYRRLEEAFGRRAVVERAKGIVMERNGVDEREAFELLRGQARRSGTRLVAVARAVLEARELLPEHGPVADDADR